MKLSGHCFAVTGLYYISPWNVNAGFIAGDEKTLVVDSGSNAISAQTVYGYAVAAKPDNELLLINTERHLDHIGGNAYFAEKGAPVYGHPLIDRKQEELAAMIRELNEALPDQVRRDAGEAAIAFEGTEIVNPGYEIEKDSSFDLGGISVRVFPTPGHTRTNLSVYSGDDGVLYCGDCVLSRMIPNLEEGGIEEWNEWIDSLAKIKAIAPAILVPGHGNVVFGHENILQEIERMEFFLRKAIRENKSPTVSV